MSRLLSICALTLLTTNAVRADIPQLPPQHVQDTAANRKQLLTLADLKTVRPPIQGKFGSELVQHQRTQARETWDYSTRQHAGTPSYLNSETVSLPDPAAAAAAYAENVKASREGAPTGDDWSSQVTGGQQRLVLRRKFEGGDTVSVDARLGTRVFHFDLAGVGELRPQQLSALLHDWMARSCSP